MPEDILLVRRVDVVQDTAPSQLCFSFMSDVAMMLVKVVVMRFLGRHHGGGLADGVVEVIGGRRCGIAGSIASGVGLGGAARSEGIDSRIPCRNLAHCGLCEAALSVASPRLHAPSKEIQGLRP